ncbi:MAG TPA: M14 family metallopeptidase [Casimicrobiaceae bacterium]|nr:M14 family metallopeptidase [Casimicrobiaceae bacterium]
MSISSNEVVESFAQSYAEARDKFLAAARERGAHVDSVVHALPGRDGEVLATDFAIIGPANASALLTITSGTHGVEGFCGSGAQIGLLRDAAFAEQVDRCRVAVLFVHAVNPYGFSFWRRVNEDNVDVNRNCRDFARSPTPNPGYAEVHHLVVPEVWPPDAENRQAVGVLVAKHGLPALQATVSRGQSEFPDGLFYAGRAPVWSNVTMRDALGRYGNARARLAWIDIHSGLGPAGHGEKIYSGSNEPTMLARARAWFGNDVTSFYEGTSTSAEVEGPLCHAALAECAHAELTLIGLEFGTRPFIDVLTALRGEQWLHNHPQVPAPVGDAIKRMMRDAFYVDSPAWKGMIYGQTRTAVFQALNGLAER